MNEQRCDQCPDSAVQQVVVAENEILLGEGWVLLPGPETRRYTKEYDEGIRSQSTPRRSGMNLSHSHRNFLIDRKINSKMENLQIIAGVRQIETLVDQREIGDDVVQNGVIERRPVGERRIFDFDSM